MLERVNLDVELSKTEYQKAYPPLRNELAQLQRKVVETGTPVVIVLEGLEASGKGTAIGNLVRGFDPRGFKVVHIKAPSEEESFRPFLWRFWLNLPGRGEITVFDRSWYGRVLVERVDKLTPNPVWQRAYSEINEFERQIAASGTLVIKLWLHIGKKEQKRRFKRFLKDPYRGWKITKADWRHHKAYNKFIEAANDMLKKTDAPHAPWTVIESHDRRFATVKISRTVARAIQSGLNGKPMKLAAGKTRGRLKDDSAGSVFADVDTSVTMTKEEYTERLEELQETLTEYEYRMYDKRLPAMVVYEGWDAGGKGGNIKRLTEKLDPRGYRVIPIAAPQGEDKTHHYLWRFWRHLPKAGHLTIFDRSWYGRVMVERIEGFCKEDDWRRAYDEINEFERQVAAYPTVIAKFWIHISREEQLRRFKEREATPHKRWKLTDEDWRNREKWDQYETAVSDMIRKTSTSYAPWTIIEGNCKYWARIKALDTLCRAIKSKL